MLMDNDTLGWLMIGAGFALLAASLIVFIIYGTPYGRGYGEVIIHDEKNYSEDRLPFRISQTSLCEEDGGPNERRKLYKNKSGNSDTLRSL